MFVDSAESDPLAAVIIANDPADRTRIDAAARAGFIVRTRADEAGLAEQRAAALATGAHALSSDYPTMFMLPSGTPSRCNPVTAPAGCTAGAIGIPRTCVEEEDERPAHDAETQVERGNRF